MYKLAKRYGARHPVRESEQYGNGLVGLTRACQTWDPSKGASFMTYAFQWIRAEIVRPHQQSVNVGKRGFGKADRQMPFSQAASQEGEGTWDPAVYKGPSPLDEAIEHDEAADNARQVHDLLRRLPERHQRLIRKHVMEGRTLDDVGAEEGITRERVRQLVNKGLRKIHEYVDRSPILLQLKAKAEEQCA